MDDSASKHENDFQKKPEHPRVKGNFLSNLFFCWGLPVLYQGWMKEFDETDLYKPLSEHESHKLGDKLEEQWKLEKLKSNNPQLMKALWRIFKKEIIGYGVVLFLQEFVLGLSQPLALRKLMSYYTPGQTKVSLQEAYIYAGIMILASFLQVIVNHNYLLACHHLGMKMRVACCSLIYRKTMKLSKTALCETTIGQMINLLSNDVARFDVCMRNFHYLWVAPLETMVIMYMLYNIVGITSAAGFCLLVIFIPLQMVLGKLASMFRLKTASKTDERVRITNEIINGIQVIKLFNWENAFLNIVEKIRRLEIRQIRYASYVRAVHISCSKYITRISVFLCVLTFTFMGNRPNAEYVYVLSSFYNILKQSMTNYFPQGISDLAEVLVSIRRIETFLMFNEVRPLNYRQPSQKKIASSTPLLNASHKKSIGIYMFDVSAKWNAYLSDTTLSDICMNVGPKQLAAIVGSVGSGKTSLLHVIMKELPIIKGIKDVVGTISYASQEPWLFSGSIKENILFGEQYSKTRYEEVVRVCALERDFEILPFGDRTIIGNKGISLSGGQRARINLARAVYKEADIYLLDDPLSAVDTLVGKQLFDDCISGFLKSKCTILVTHQLQYLKNAHKIFVMENGTIVVSGDYQEIQNSDTEFAKLFKAQLENEDADESLVMTSSNSSSLIKEYDEEPTEIKETRCSGAISKRVYKCYFRAAGGWCYFIWILSLFVMAQFVSSVADYFIKFWVNLEQTRYQRLRSNETLTKYLKNDLYLKQNPNTTVNVFYLDFMNELDKFFTTDMCFYVYSLIIIAVVVSITTRSIFFYKYCLSASATLHKKMFKSVINATMRFFNVNCSGRILNRFSKDMGSIDEKVPYVLIDTIQIALNVLAVNILIATLKPWILLPTVVIAGLFYIYRVIFLRTSRSIKRMEATTRSPVFSHMASSLQGLTTIRAFGAQEMLRSEFDAYQDAHSSAFYMFIACNEAFGFWLDFHCIIYTALVTLSFFFMGNGHSKNHAKFKWKLDLRAFWTPLRYVIEVVLGNIFCHGHKFLYLTESYGGNVGLAITQAMSLTGMFQWGMRQWSELENNMISVERVVDYTDVEREVESLEKNPPKGWPEKGLLEFKSVYLRYAKNEPYVLNNLTFRIKPKEKVGIVGRTGAGKSSLIAALFRLAEVEGKILIDGICTRDIPLSTMRSKISIIPQEPIVFSGTIRSNLDPLKQYTDRDIWHALEEVELKDVVSEFKAGLHSKMLEGGANFSVGQRQLMCLARAILRNNKVLVLDEATANVDPKTDALIQNTIRKKFADCTVLTIAHRLHTVMDSDKVIVMDAGECIEFNHPYILLQNPEGVFYGLVKETGKATAEYLSEVARANFNSLPEFVREKYFL